MISGILGPLTRGYLPHVIATGLANNDPVGVANNERIDGTRLPSFDITTSGDSHGQDNELDTHKAAQLGLSIVSRILRYLLGRSEEHTSELQSRENLVCRLLLEKKKKK